MSLLKAIIIIMLISLASPARADTDLEGHFREKYEFYYLKFKYKDNYFNLNIPGSRFLLLSGGQRSELIRYLSSLYGDVFDVYALIFGHVPEGYKFNVTFGKTSEGHPYNRIYAASKTSNIFPDCLPFDMTRQALTEKQRWIMIHEIAHSLFAIKIGTFEHPKMKAIEEGFIDYISEQAEGMDYSRLRQDIMIKVPPGRLKNMKGLTQLDVEISIFGEGAVINSPRDGSYAGFAHHTFGLEFIKSFISVFGEQALPGFMKRLRKVDRSVSKNDLGTQQIKDILRKMGYTKIQIKEFEDNLHTRLKQYVYNGDVSPHSN